MQTITITTDQTIKLDYEKNWKDLVTYEDYLSILEQQAAYDNNAVGYETYARNNN